MKILSAVLMITLALLDGRVAFGEEAPTGINVTGEIVSEIG